VSEQYEPSYYEIALTGRQVLVAFVILLVCLVAAFFSGVWVGRGGPGGAGTAEAAETVAQSGAQAGTGPTAGEAQATAGDKATPKKEGVDALSFFDQEAEGRGSSGGEPAAKSAEPPAAQVSKPPASAPPQEAAGGGEGASAPEASKPKTAEASGAAARPEHPREAANPSGALSGGDVVIQVFSSADEAKAKEILDRLEANDFRAFISPVTDDGRTLYRVRVGPFEHPEDAERVAAELRRRLDLDTWITR